MWQMQNGQPKLIGYSSKTLPKACLNYSVTELEMHGKDEPKGHIGRILEKILDYTFQYYYVKGKDLILANYFSRVPVNRRQANEVIPISFINLCQPDDLTMFGMMTR